MADLIDRQELVSRLKKAGRFLKSCENTKAVTKAIGSVIDHIKTAPAVDAVEVVRCKDCKHFDTRKMECQNDAVSTDHEGGASYSLNFYLDDFCSYGERRADNG